MTPRHLAMGAALLLAVGLTVFGGSPQADVAEAVARAPRSANAPVRSPPPARAQLAAPAAEPVIFALEDRARLIGDNSEALGQGAQIFGSQDWNPPPPPAPPPAPPEPPPVPTAPALPFTYMGKALEKGSWEVFLNRSGQVYIVRNKTVIDGTYRVDAIAPPVMTLTYLPLNEVQQLNIGVLE
jgi:hypothetical protein